MRSKFLVALVAVASMCLATFLAPAAASATPAPTADVAATVKLATCDSPPDDPAATPENRDRYVQLWSARIADKAWMQHFASLATVPDDIKAEGFHDMSGQVQMWLNACLLDDMLATAKETPSDDKYNHYLMGLNLVIFGKAGIQQMRDRLNETTKPDPASTLPVKKDQTAEALAGMVDDLSSQPSLTSADQPKADVSAPTTSVTKNNAGSASPQLQQLTAQPAITPTTTTPTPALTPNPNLTGIKVLDDLVGIPLVQLVLKAINELLQVVANIQQKLFTLPVVNLLATAFYRICAESPTMPLACSVSLPVGVPIPADVTGDNLPDVTGTLFPTVNLLRGDVGANFLVQRLYPNSGPLPAHVFAVYDTPLVKKRIEFGYDGRASTLARNTQTAFKLNNAVAAATGDISVSADVQSNDPGSTEALTFAVKSLVGGSAGVLPTEADPMVGSVQMNPFPTTFSVSGHLTHASSQDEDVFTVASSTPTRVDATIDQKTTTTSPQSSRRFNATVDKLPTSVTVDLVHQGEKQSIDYSASAPIDLVRATDTATGDVSHPGSFTESAYEVHGVPTHVHVDLQGAQDVKYTASDKIPEVDFSTRTLVDSTLQQQVTAKAHQVPKSIHVTNLTTADDQKVGYTADDKLADVELGMYDKNEAGVETNLVAKATGIPTQMQFTSTKATGAYDFTSNTGIGLIEATLTRNNGSVLPMPGLDHATVYKRGEQLGVDFRLSGFTSAHFDGHQKTDVGLGLSPGGQTFDAIADITDPGGPNVLATAHVGALPSSMNVTFDPGSGKATYQASSVIPLLKATFTDRATSMSGDVKLTDLPKSIGLTFNTSGAVPAITYAADSRLGSIEANYTEKPGGLVLHAKISDLPQYMKIGGINPIVFDARSAAGDPVGSSYLGQIFFQYGTDGTFASAPTTDDHAYLDTNTVDRTHAELLYTGLQLLSVNTANQELHAEVRNTSPRLFRAYVITPSVTLTGFIDKVPADVKIDQVDKVVTYDASSPISEVYTDVNRANGDHLAVDVTNIPKTVSVLFDGGNAKLQWDSSAAAGGFSAIAHLTPSTIGGTRAFDASLGITSIPTHWDASWADGNVLFQAPSPGIGSITARVTNHGAYHVLGGDHLSAFFDQTAGDAPGDLDASLAISNLTRASFTKITNATGGGFQANLDMGTHGAFKLSGNVTLPGTKLLASGQFDNLPSHIALKSDSGRITYTGDTNPDLTLSVKAGTPAAVSALPFVPMVHGVAARDASSGGGKAYGANVYLTGLPTSLDLNAPAGTYEVTGYHPTNDTLHVDVALTTLAPQPLTLQAQQVVPTASPVNFKFGPFLSATDGAGNHTMSLNYTSNQDLGALTAEATYGNTDDARLEISEIPKSISVNTSFGADTKTVGLSMNHGIGDITASYKKVGETSFAASVHLHDVPSAVNINIGKDSSSSAGTDVDAPVFTMTTSSAGMDIDAFATAEISDSLTANAAVTLSVHDLGQTVTGDLTGSTLHITSSPATGSFSLQAGGRVQKSIPLTWDGGIFQNTGNLGADLKIDEVTVGLTDFSDVRLRLGFTTGLDGDFGTFTFGQKSNLTIDIEDHFSVFIDWPDPFGSETINLISIPHQSIPLGNVVPQWHVNANQFGNIFKIPFFSYVIGDCHVSFDARPAPGFTTATPIFTLGAPPDDGTHTPAWLLTPDIHLLGLSVPDFGLDIIAFFLSPYGHGIKAYPECTAF